MRVTAVASRLEGSNVVRFDIHQRIQHIIMFSSFIILAATGLPLKFGDSAVSQWWIALWSGVENTRAIHRWAGVAMALDCVYHAIYIGISIVILKRPFPMQMLPNPKDILDFVQDMKYIFGISKERPKFGRFSYREKFDYWAVFWGIAIMVGGGAILMFPVLASKYLPGWIVPVALMAHSDEAILAIGWILVVHMFFSHLAPNVFPFNKSIFTGRVSQERYAEEHTLEYNQMVQNAVAAQPPPIPPAPEPEKVEEVASNSLNTAR